jgi:hypothetical protein
MRSDTTRQQRGVLLVALLGMRRLQSNPKPTRKQVLRFIRNANLISWNEHELDWSEANCSVGENRISWRRKDFVQDGILKPGPSKPSWTNWHLQGPGRTEYGIWELTESGVTKIELIVKDWSEGFDKDNNFFNELKDTVPELKLTNEFMNLVLQLAHNDFKTKFFPKLATPSAIV